MNRFAALSVLLVMPCAVYAQADLPIFPSDAAPPKFVARKNYVHLDRPGVLERIQEQNPGHYARIAEVLRVAQMEPCETVPQVLKTNADASASNVTCSARMLLTSYPAKRHLTFTLDDVQYSSNVVQFKTLGNRALPLENWFAQPLAAK